ncbi:hypothetical protein LJC72_05170 [Bacteroides sp. OttesenSCG-928-D19]|nr:hypothetical protein [Bacteroides sp. OttesenSCG-928-D19]
MKRIQTKLATAILAAIILATGCTKDDAGNQPTTGKVPVVMRGGMAKITNSTRATVDPQLNGLPPQQLDINIITVNYTTSAPNKISGQPKIEDWSGQTADNTRGFFGEKTEYTSTHNNNPIIKPADRETYIPNTGRIEYTDEAGEVVQKVFYDENGEYYFVRLFYPFNEDGEEFYTEFTSTTAGLGASIIFHNVDGSQDILCSNLGWGNNDNPLINTTIVKEDEDTDEVENDSQNGEIVFSHMMALFRIKIKPESAVVVEREENLSSAQYGEITNVQVVRQPSTLIADAMTGAIRPLNDPLETNYLANNFPEGGFTLTGTGEGTNFVGYEQPAGYIIVYPGQTTYRIEVQTAKHKWVHGDLKFTTPVQAGKAYNITITMMEAYEMEIKETVVDNWWMDHIFN